MSLTGDLSAEIAKALSEYSSELEDEIDAIAQELGDEAVTTLKATSPKKQREVWKRMAHQEKCQRLIRDP